jgi:hypothetical protein
MGEGVKVRLLYVDMEKSGTASSVRSTANSDVPAGLEADPE